MVASAGVAQVIGGPLARWTAPVYHHATDNHDADT